MRSKSISAFSGSILLLSGDSTSAALLKRRSDATEEGGMENIYKVDQPDMATVTSFLSIRSKDECALHEVKLALSKIHFNHDLC